MYITLNQIAGRSTCSENGIR